MRSQISRMASKICAFREAGIRGVQARVLSNQDGHWVFAKPLADGDVAIALFNETTSSAAIGTTAAVAGLPRSAGYTARDLWAHRDLQTAGRISAVVPPHTDADRRQGAFAPSPHTPRRARIPVDARRRLLSDGDWWNHREDRNGQHACREDSRHSNPAP